MLIGYCIYPTFSKLNDCMFYIFASFVLDLILFSNNSKLHLKFYIFFFFFRISNIKFENLKFIWISWKMDAKHNIHTHTFYLHFDPIWGFICKRKNNVFFVCWIVYPIATNFTICFLIRYFFLVHVVTHLHAFCCFELN